MEQMILQEPLFLVVGELVRKPVLDFGQESLYPSGKGKGWCLPPPDLLGKNPSLADQRTLHYHIQWSIFIDMSSGTLGPILQMVSVATPLRECCIPSHNTESL